MKKTVGFFGGSFDPIHFGHIHLAIEMLEKEGLDEILFCPAFSSPFKEAAILGASALHRFEMLKIVIDDIPGFSVTSIEVDRKRPSYTVETLEMLKENQVQYRLILSEESAKRFFEWKDPNEILRLAPPLIGARGKKVILDPLLQNAIVQTPLFDISSTQVRQRLKKRLYCGHLVPAKALDYIDRHQLYL